MAYCIEVPLTTTCQHDDSQSYVYGSKKIDACIVFPGDKDSRETDLH